MKRHARVVVVGGGIVGCSVLYHLTRMGWHDVALVERGELTSGSTWHAAGNCPNFSTSWNVIKLQHYSNRLYGRLAADTDTPIDRHVTGSIRLAHRRDRMDEFAHVASMAHHQGLEFELLAPDALRQQYPYLETHDLVGALWDPLDGDIDPSQVTQAMAKGARDAGAEIYRNNPVEAIGRTKGGEWQVRTRDGVITAEAVVNAAGYRAGEVAAMVGLKLPMVNLQHQYMITEPIAELSAREGRLPLLRDPDDSYYLRQERDGLLLGPYEWDATPCWRDGIPPDFAMELFGDDLERLERYIEYAIARVPLLGKVGVRRVVNGPIPYTPDGLPLIGPAFGLDNFYLCAGFSFGIVQGGGAGKTMAEIIVEGAAEWDMWMMDPRRYTAYANQAYTLAKAIELYQNEYAVVYPQEERPAGRPAKTTPLYHRLRDKGAMFGARGGWERATWFPAAGEPATEQPSFRRTNWFEAVARECRAVRQRVGVLDLGGFSKFEVSGPGAAAFLDRLGTGRLPNPGRISLTYFCAENGGLLGELTIARLAEDRFYLCSAAAAEWHDQQWLDRHRPRDGSVTVANTTEQYATLVLAGPRARDVLAKITDADLSNGAFPWLGARPIEIGFASVLAIRINYVGELGWELHLPTADQAPVYEALMAAGEEYDIADFGMYAMDSLRLEKCYPAWKLDLTHEYTPLESSLDRFVKLDKADFIGRAALLAQQQSGVPQRLVPLVLDAVDADAPVCATVFQDGREVGLVTSAGYGHVVEKSIALAYVRADALAADTALEVDVLGTRIPAVVVAAPIYDPTNARLRA